MTLNQTAIRTDRFLLLKLVGRKFRDPALLRPAWQVVWLLVLTFACYLFVSQFLFSSIRVDGPSMIPTLSSSDLCFLNRWIYHVREPRRFEVVVVRDPTDDGYSVKRIVGMPGECVYLNKQGHLYVDGRRLAEPFLPPSTRTYPRSKFREQVILCGKGEYVVFGDNRNNSIDSRCYGAIPRSQILGLIMQ
jgi:signal peptidase I